MLFSNPRTLRQRTIAAAGLLQALILLQEQANIKRQPATSKYFLRQSIRSVFVLKPKDAESVYSSVAGVQRGLETLGEIGSMSYPSSNDGRNEIIGYALGVIKIARQLNHKNYRNIRSTLYKELEAVGSDFSQTGAKSKDPDDPELYAEIDRVYRNTISKLPYRVRLFGHPDRLNVTAVAHKLRTLLLASIRSAVLWQQYGGNLLHLFMERQNMLEQSKALLCQVQEDERSLESK